MILNILKFMVVTLVNKSFKDAFRSMNTALDEQVREYSAGLEIITVIDYKYEESRFWCLLGKEIIK